MTKSSHRHTVYFTKTVQKDYDSIRDLKLKRGIDRIIDDLKQNPYQFKKLSGPFASMRSAKTFSFRVLYTIEDEKLIVLIIAIEHRRESYR